MSGCENVPGAPLGGAVCHALDTGGRARRQTAAAAGHTQGIHGAPLPQLLRHAYLEAVRLGGKDARSQVQGRHRAGVASLLHQPVWI